MVIVIFPTLTSLSVLEMEKQELRQDRDYLTDLLKKRLCRKGLIIFKFIFNIWATII